ncbi:MAG: hypothetical protein IKE85_07675 [Mogibacterium sp.]|nr:hypothetical protein [Mogibacterium sp.]MBR2540677.1 hypothetical protein [Mogibacterium sp.]
MKEVRFINHADKSKGEFALATPTFGGRASVDVCLCRDCKKKMIDY